MIRSTLGAPFGGTTRGGHQGLEFLASSLITPPNFGGGGGSCFPSREVVALGEPGVPVTCWAFALAAANPRTNRDGATTRATFPVQFMNVLLLLPWQRNDAADTLDE